MRCRRSDDMPMSSGLAAGLAAVSDKASRTIVRLRRGDGTVFTKCSFHRFPCRGPITRAIIAPGGWREMTHRTSAALLIAAALTIASIAIDAQHPAAGDLEGIWNYATMTPLERPRDLAARATLTPAEAA